MTQSDTERKERGAASGRGGMSLLWIAIGIVLILLLAWWFWPDGEDARTSDVVPDMAEPAGEEMGSESNLEGEVGTTTSSDRVVAIPASPGIATRDVENVDATGGDGTSATSTAATDALPVREILDDPDGWSGRAVNGVVQVGSMANERAFWIDDGDDRLLTLIVDPASVVRRSVWNLSGD